MTIVQVDTVVLTFSTPVPLVDAGYVFAPVTPFNLNVIPLTVHAAARIVPAVTPLTLSTPALAGPTGHTLGSANALQINTAATWVQNGVIGGSTGLSLATIATWVINRAAGRSLEDRVATLGYRPATPVWVRAIDVQRAVDIVTLLDDDSFLVSNVFIEDPADPFYQEGARRAYVGTKSTGPAGVYFIFRKPEPEEVVWYARRLNTTVLVDEVFQPDYEDNGFYRFYVDTAVWRAYVSMAERAAEQQYASTILDPSHIIRYFARLLGSMHGALAYDIRKLYDAFDARNCPDVFIPYLGAQFGQDIDLSRSEQEVREAIIGTLPQTRFRAQDPGVYLALRAAGYHGYVRAIWVDPRFPPAGDTWTDPALPPGLVNPLVPEQGAGPPAGAIHYDGGGLLTITIASNLATRGILPRAHTGWKGWRWFTAPHGYYAHDPAAAPAFLANYWPTALLTLHLNNVDGTPLDMSAGTAVTEAIIEAATKAVESSLPVHARIRMVATDWPVAGLAGERLQAVDTMTISQF